MNDCVPVGWFEAEQRAAAARREAASLSMSHNSDDSPTETENLPFKLSGSQRKTAYALEKNVARLIEDAGLERCAFLTLTVGDETAEGFRQVWCPYVATKRLGNLTRRVLADLFPRSVIVTERHASGAIHFHLIVECRQDVRTGFDFAAFLAARTARGAGTPDFAAERAYAASATPHLRGLWGVLRDRLPAYGFGRAELTPIYKTGEAISRYVSKYVEKNLSNRRKEDKGKKLVRYHGWEGKHMRPNDFAWNTPRAAAWRANARLLARMGGVYEFGDMAKAFGPRWAWRITGLMNEAGMTLEETDQEADGDYLSWREMVGRWVEREIIFPDWDRWECLEAWEEYHERLAETPAREFEPTQEDFFRAA